MSFDGIVTQAVVNELNQNLIGGRINKIYQHEKDEILIHIRNNGTNHRLLISSSSSHPRIYLTEHTKENPLSPPNFCMVLRKHLVGGRILSISQFEFDRVIHMDISALDELGQNTSNKLIIEIMGKHSNIILINEKDLKIIDSIKKVNYEMSRVRQILPGLIYSNPPTQNKLDPRFSSKEEFLNLLSKSKEPESVYKFLYQNYQGLSPLISKEICFNSNVEFNKSILDLTEKEMDTIYSQFYKFMSYIKEGSYSPTYIINENNSIIAFHSLNLKQFGDLAKYERTSISRTLDIVYKKKDNYDRISQKSQSMRKSIQTKLDRALNKLGKQKDELLISKKRDSYKIYADLISANLYRIAERSESVVLENFYDENMSEITIPLDHKFSAVENAQRYYKRYGKLKNAENRLLQQIPETENEILYLENVLLSIDNSLSPEDLKEITEELTEEGYLKPKKDKKNRKSKQHSKFSPHHYISRDNFNIYVGKNNKQNDYLTLRYAHKNDIWLHVQNMPGSHVIIKKDNKEIPDSTLEEAALLAAYYSNGKNGINIPVDFTERKNVKKLSNSKPGMVRYDNFNTIIISPIRELVSEIKKISL